MYVMIYKLWLYDMQKLHMLCGYWVDTLIN